LNLSYVFPEFFFKTAKASGTVFLNGNPIYNTCINNICDNKFSATGVVYNYGNYNITTTIFLDDLPLNFTNFYFILLAILLFETIACTVVIFVCTTLAKYEIGNKMLSYVNHEIRNPLNCIASLIQISMDEIDELMLIQLGDTNGKCDRSGEFGKYSFNEMKSNLFTAVNACALLNHIVNDILDFRKLYDNKLEICKTEINFKLFSKSVHNIIRSKLSENPQVEFKIENPNNIQSFFSDRNRILQVVLNFLTNAMKFTESGTIVLKIEKIMEITNDIKISITDTGRGIAKKDFHKIFSPFSQTGPVTERSLSSSGLGLYLCKMLAHLFPGEVGFTSKLNIGSSFWVILYDAVINDSEMVSIV
jgi:signal transduction histidine kinase